MAVSQANRERFRLKLLSRSFKDLFARAVLKVGRRAWFYNWLFRGENGEIRHVGEHVLADLREFCWLGAYHTTIFDTDPLIMARREGRREVGMRIIKMLNLDETAVQQMMELDDGL